MRHAYPLPRHIQYYSAFAFMSTTRTSKTIVTMEGLASPNVIFWGRGRIIIPEVRVVKPEVWGEVGELFCAVILEAHT